MLQKIALNFKKWCSEKKTFRILLKLPKIELKDGVKDDSYLEGG